MKILIPSSTSNYRLIDSGDGFKLEQFGLNTIVRPESICLWHKHATDTVWQKASATVGTDKRGLWIWKKTTAFKEPWLFSYKLPSIEHALVCQLRLSPSKNIGVFPEQAAQWE